MPKLPDPPAAPGPAAMLLYNDWYPAMRSDLLRGKKLSTTLLLGIPLVLGRREDGRLFAMRDSCPHRGIPLSCGWFDGQALTCKYHGWAFEPVSGQCMEIPSLTENDPFPHKLAGTAYPCEERDGYAWVYIPEPGSGRVRAEDAALVPVPELPKFSDRPKRPLRVSLDFSYPRLSIDQPPSAGCPSGSGKQPLSELCCIYPENWLRNNGSGKPTREMPPGE